MTPHHQPPPQYPCSINDSLLNRDLPTRPVMCPPSRSRPGEQLGLRSRATSAGGCSPPIHTQLTQRLGPASGKRQSRGRGERGDDLHANPTTPGCGGEAPAAPPAPPAHPLPIGELREQKKSSPLQRVRSLRPRGRA